LILGPYYIIIEIITQMKNILLIDDDEIIQKVLFKVLQQQGYHVVAGKDGRDGLEKLNEMKFDIVITDIMMPYLNGFELIQSLKTHPNSIDSKVVVISSVTHQDSINDSMNLGVDVYIPKPIVIDAFIAKIKQLVQ
jgi:DNA-binding response OmpR family regulator